MYRVKQRLGAAARIDVCRRPLESGGPGPWRARLEDRRSGAAQAGRAIVQPRRRRETAARRLRAAWRDWRTARADGARCTPAARRPQVGRDRWHEPSGIRFRSKWPASNWADSAIRRSNWARFGSTCRPTRWSPRACSTTCGGKRSRAYWRRKRRPAIERFTPRRSTSCGGNATSRGRQPPETIAIRSRQTQLHVLVRTMEQLQAVVRMAASSGPGLVYCDFEDVRRYRDAVKFAHAARPADRPGHVCEFSSRARKVCWPRSPMPAPTPC